MTIPRRKRDEHHEQYHSKVGEFDINAHQLQGRAATDSIGRVMNAGCSTLLERKANFLETLQYRLLTEKIAAFNGLRQLLARHGNTCPRNTGL